MNMEPINLSKPHRLIRAGVILVNSSVWPQLYYDRDTDLKHRTTEILDVAPIDIFNALTKEFLHNFPEAVLPAHLKAQALDIQFHWVNETGVQGKLTAGATINPTVRNLLVFTDRKASSDQMNLGQFHDLSTVGHRPHGRTRSQLQSQCVIDSFH